MTPATLVADLQARGVTLEPRGAKLAVRPVSRVTPRELEALRCHKAEVLALLAQPSQRLALDRETNRPILDRCPAPAADAVLAAEVHAAIQQYRLEVTTGVIGPGVLTVRGRPLSDYLDLDTVARLLGARPSRGMTSR